jgi:predicted signal transduction protein with EAL and GGDEF domain
MELCGVEALARWESPSIGAVPAEMLIATAERLGMARQVTLALFTKAMLDLAAIPEAVRLSFNLSATDLADRETIDTLVAMIAGRTGHDRRIVFEITETSVIRDFDKAREALARLRAEGAGIALDDFGTGYSSLAALNQLQIDLIKIDRSFASRLTDPAGRRLMAAVRNLVSALDVDCVFEGIETEGQLLEATLAGFHYIQGYYLARPDKLKQALRFAVPPDAPRPCTVRSA